MSAKRSVLARSCVALALWGCEQKPRSPPDPPPAAAPAPAPEAAPVVPAPPPALGRAGLLDSAATAASAAAGGAPYPEAVRSLAGRPYAIDLAFGCGADDGAVYDARAKALRLTRAPQVWTDTPELRAIVGAPEAEAVEGHWVRWPWLRDAVCPGWAAGQPGTAAPQTVGLARVFQAGGSRLTRRAVRGYEATIKADAPSVNAAFRLRLEGRIANPEDGRPIRCTAPHRDARPVCLILVEPDRAAFLDAEGDVLAEWPG